MISVHTAWQDGSAMVLFVGLIPVTDRGRDSFQEFNLPGWFGTTAKNVAPASVADPLVQDVGARLAAAAYDAVPHSSPAWAGWLGYGRADTIAGRLDEADLLLFIGCGRSDVMSDSYTRGSDAETILVLPDPDATMHAGRIDLQIVAAPASFVAVLPCPFGGHGETVEATADVEGALGRALASGVPSLLHIRLDPGILPPSSANTIEQGDTA